MLFKELNKFLQAAFVIPSYLTCANWSVVALYQLSIVKPVMEVGSEVIRFSATNSKVTFLVGATISEMLSALAASKCTPSNV